MPVKFVLFDLWPDLVDAWREAFEALVPKDCLANVTIVHSAFDELKVPFDCVVSPANSFGRLDGSFDQVLSDCLAPEDDPDALTRAAQNILYKRWRGFAPPGTCTLIPLAGTPCEGNALKCRIVALCPTMRYPAIVSWHREIVYNCVWSLLVEIDEHNARVAAGEVGELRAIETVAMTGLATGVGGVSAKQCAKHTALAFAHYHEAKSNPEKWSALGWRDIERMPLDPKLSGA